LPLPPAQRKPECISSDLALTSRYCWHKIVSTIGNKALLKIPSVESNSVSSETKKICCEAVYIILDFCCFKVIPFANTFMAVAEGLP
jgi:hypothetical protein